MKTCSFFLFAAACWLGGALASPVTGGGPATDNATNPGANTRSEPDNAAIGAATAAAGAVAAPYTVVGGTQVDPKTLNGWRTWRAMACERCHGAQQEGLVGPSLVNSLKVLTRDEFKNTVLHGRVPKGMPNFDGSKQVTDNIDNLYAYLKGRSDGAIQPGHLQEIGK